MTGITIILFQMVTTAILTLVLAEPAPLLDLPRIKKTRAVQIFDAGKTQYYPPHNQVFAIPINHYANFKPELNPNPLHMLPGETITPEAQSEVRVLCEVTDYWNEPIMICFGTVFYDNSIKKSNNSRYRRRIKTPTKSLGTLGTSFRLKVFVDSSSKKISTEINNVTGNIEVENADGTIDYITTGGSAKWTEKYSGK